MYQLDKWVPLTCFYKRFDFVFAIFSTVSNKNHYSIPCSLALQVNNNEVDVVAGSDNDANAHVHDDDDRAALDADDVADIDFSNKSMSNAAVMMQSISR